MRTLGITNRYGEAEMGADTNSFGISSILPPCASAYSRAMDNPSPVPLIWLSSIAAPGKRARILSHDPLHQRPNPRPRYPVEPSRLSCSSRCGCSRPAGENFTAFDNRLSTIILIFCSSQSIIISGQDKLYSQAFAHDDKVLVLQHRIQNSCQIRLLLHQRGFFGLESAVTQ